MRKYLYLTTAYALLIIALHLFSAFLPPLSNWGFSHLNEFSITTRVLFYLLALAVCLPPLNSRLARALERLTDRATGLRSALSPHFLYALASAFLGALFWWQRSGNLFLGDGVTVAKVVRSDAALRYYVGGWAGHLTSHQLVDFWLARNLHRLLSQVLEFESYDTVALISCAAGALFCLAVLETGHLLFEGRGRRLAFATVVFSTGAMQLFFGYVETYSLATAALALFCLTTLMYARGRCGAWIPALLLGLSGSLHMLTAGAGLALLYAYIHRSRERGRYSAAELASLVAAPAFVVAVYLVILWSLGFSLGEIFFAGPRKDYEGVFFLSLTRKGYLLERYSLLSIGHLIDILNEIVLVTPFGIFLCALSLPRFLRHNRAGRPEATILLLTCIIYLGVTLTAAPLLGGRKDWDVFAPPWVFITMLGAYLLLRAIDFDHLLRRLLVVVVGVSLTHTIPWIGSNARIDLEEYLALRGRGDSLKQAGRTAAAIDSYEAALAINFTPELAHETAKLRIREGRLKQAADLLQRAIRHENRSELAVFLEQEESHYLLGIIYLNLQMTDQATEEFNRAIELWEFRHNESFGHLPDVYYHLGVAHVRKERYKAAEKAFLSALEEKPNFPQAHLALSEVYARHLNDPDSARFHLLQYLASYPKPEGAVED